MRPECVNAMQYVEKTLEVEQPDPESVPREDDELLRIFRYGEREMRVYKSTNGEEPEVYALINGEEAVEVELYDEKPPSLGLNSTAENESKPDYQRSRKTIKWSRNPPH